MRRARINIKRIIIIALYVFITALIISALSAVFGYLNTGADRSTMLHTDIKRTDQYLPKLEWKAHTNQGRPIDKENLKLIEKDYLNAWFVKHVAYKTNSTQGIKDYYTKKARENLYNTIKENLAKNVTLESTTLKHNPSLEFFSEDGQLAVITDTNVVEFKRILKNDKLITESKEESNYKVILILEDGFWRIRHMIKEKSTFLNTKNNYRAVDTMQIKGINYYPKAAPWNMFSNEYNAAIILEDFKIIKAAGLNTVRIFIQYEDFNKAHVNIKKLQRLRQILDIAKENNIKVIVTLFDFYGDYSVLDWTLTQRHAERIVSNLKNHDALLAWDIKNEPDLDFDKRGKNLVVAWLDNMIDLVRSIDNKTPITIGWSNTESAPILNHKVDYVSFHFYQDLKYLDASIRRLKRITPNKPIIMQEFGMSSNKSVWNPFGNSEKSQANYHKKAQQIITENNLHYLSWTLYDFEKIPKTVVGRLPWRKHKQKRFGFIKSDGSKKAAFKHISQ